MRLQDPRDVIGKLRTGEVIEINSSSAQGVRSILDRLCARLEARHLHAVSLGRLMRDAGLKV